MQFVDPARNVKGRTFVASPENPSGVKSGGVRMGDMLRVNPRYHVQPNETLTLLDMDGPGMIQNMWFGGRHGWHMILRIYWDNSEIPSVEAPLSAFLGYAYYDNITDVEGNPPILNSALISSAPFRGFSASFQMPFSRHCRITIENRDYREQHVLYYAITGMQTDIPSDSLYFHASYRQALPVAAGEPYVVIDDVNGTGNFLGVTLSVGLNGQNGCWMVGEVKIFLDDDIYPSINYCGMEDYFGGSYAFGYTDLGRYCAYSTPYSGMFAILGGNNLSKNKNDYNAQSRFMCYRWHLPDPIHFEKNFRMIIPSLGHGPMGYGDLPRRDDYASVAYWYQSLPATRLKPLPPEDQVCLF